MRTNAGRQCKIWCCSSHVVYVFSYCFPVLELMKRTRRVQEVEEWWSNLYLWYVLKSNCKCSFIYQSRCSKQGGEAIHCAGARSNLLQKQRQKKIRLWTKWMFHIRLLKFIFLQGWWTPGGNPGVFFCFVVFLITQTLRRDWMWSLIQKTFKLRDVEWI